MTRRSLAGLALLGLVLLGAASTSVPPTLSTLVQTERDFAAKCREVGMRDSFLQFFADDALFFVPDPVNAKEQLSKRPSVPFAQRQLTWEPRLGDVASSGELGWLTGPSQLLVPDPSKPNAAPGNQVYLSVWRKQGSGDWKVIIDIGVGQTSPASFAPGFQRFAMPDRYSGPAGKADATAKLEAADKALNDRAAKSMADGYAPALLDSSRLHRDDVPPVVGRSAILQYFRSQPGAFAGTFGKAESAESGDFGYTYGSYKMNGDAPDKPNEPKSGPYVRMWERRADGTWFLAVEVE
jgi:ketosteroid isomerase-like protein